ncbi:hypothetical protein PR202_gb06196 [Eleusine coracana subsp. coracana]|uniref:Uncharacterized protein n=1 Tax=Eleusine coracana subsp. coracana TaxID=191504 RepID=A0AAV5E6H9_ELECO|nr:hypothetical protein PR202_gb06196 [Eleusine coracana subsp. coracana]
MGQGKEVKTRPDPKVEIQEKGEIFFFYRPKVDREEAHSPDDVQRMYIVLRPESGERAVEEKQAPDSGKEGRKHGKAEEGHQGGHGEEEVNIEEQPLLRLVVMGKKSLPEPGKRGRPYWGYVELVTTNLDDIKDALEEEEYSTATRGQRRRPAARALGEGVYRILKHESGRRAATHTHLVYKLELPLRGPGEPQDALNVEPEASFLVQVKNPDPPSSGSGGGGFRGLQNKRRAAFPARLQGAFGSRRYAPADPPDLLNYEGCELLLIAASDDVEEELGLELEGEVELGEEDVEEEQAAARCSDLVKMFGDVADVKPLLSGTWD